MHYKKVVSLGICLFVVTIIATTYASGLKNPSQLIAVIAAIKAPTLQAPRWTQPTPTAKSSSQRIVSYTIGSHGTITSDMNGFASLVSQTLNDPRGWVRLGVSFQQVPSGGNLSIVLSEASLMTDYSATGCSTDLSCTVGNTIIINQDRWQSGVDFWLQQDNSLIDYRQMVINHEMGHWLGHGHLDCPGAGQSAPVMRQQSVDLQGCKPNSWPLASELWSTKLGITAS